MDIRTKLALALVAVSIVSMCALGLFAFEASASLLTMLSQRQLDSLAENKALGLQHVIDGWRDRVGLISSRTRLRTLLDPDETTLTAATLAEIQGIVDDAQRATANVVSVSIYAPDGDRIVVSGSQGPASLDRLDNTAAQTAFSGADVVDDALYVSFDAPLYREDSLVALSRVVFAARELATAASDTRGLGESGETMIVARSTDGIRLLNTPRHGVGQPPYSLLDDPSTFIVAAADGMTGLPASGHVDYRGVPVWVATRFIDETQWGLIVKVDEAEELVPVFELRSQMVELGIALSAFAVLGGTLLGLYLTNPIKKLSEIVTRARQGETTLRADIDSHDEIGFLADAFNDFLDARDDPSTPRPP